MEPTELSGKAQVGRKFDGKNYRAWKFEMKHCLLYADLYEIVIGEEEMPPMPAETVISDARESALEARRKWRRREQQARSLLVLNMA